MADEPSGPQWRQPSRQPDPGHLRALRVRLFTKGRNAFSSQIPLLKWHHRWPACTQKASVPPTSKIRLSGPPPCGPLLPHDHPCSSQTPPCPPRVFPPEVVLAWMTSAIFPLCSSPPLSLQRSLNTGQLSASLIRQRVCCVCSYTIEVSAPSS